MLRQNLVRRSAPHREGLATLADRFFSPDPFESLRWTSWPELQSSSLDTWSPAVDVHEETEAFVFTADLPGLGKDLVDVTVEDNVLTLSGQRSLESEVEEGSFRRLERSFGKFSRRFSLPSQVDAAKVSASFDNGVLSVRVPKAETAKPHKINIS